MKQTTTNTTLTIMIVLLSLGSVLLAAQLLRQEQQLSDLPHYHRWNTTEKSVLSAEKIAFHKIVTLPKNDLVILCDEQGSYELLYSDKNSSTIAFRNSGMNPRTRNEALYLELWRNDEASTDWSLLFESFKGSCIAQYTVEHQEIV